MWRWHLLLRANEIVIPFKRTLELSFIGSFFNIALPGAVSGDVIKAIYVSKVPGKRAHALSSLLFDRVAGVSGLVMVSAGSWIISLIYPLESVSKDLWTAIELSVGTAGFGAISFYAYLFFVPEDRDIILRFLRSVQEGRSLVMSVTRIYEGVRNYGKRPITVLTSLVISICIHSMLIFAFYNFSLAFGESLSPIAIGVVVPLGLLVTAVPVLPAGMGTGHAAFLALFHLLGSERGVDTFNLMVLYNLIQGAFGGIVYLTFKSHLGTDVATSMPQDGTPSIPGQSTPRT
jgi:uncharacterized protein (TIRG00374 family)